MGGGRANKENRKEKREGWKEEEGQEVNEVRESCGWDMSIPPGWWRWERNRMLTIVAYLNYLTN